VYWRVGGGRGEGADQEPSVPISPVSRDDLHQAVVPGVAAGDDGGAAARTRFPPATRQRFRIACKALVRTGGEPGAEDLLRQINGRVAH
jgi:hypothetical protein